MKGFHPMYPPTYPLDYIYLSLSSVLGSLVIAHHRPEWFLSYETAASSEKIHRIQDLLHGEEHQDLLTEMTTATCIVLS